MNHQAIDISGTEIPVIEYRDERVITFKDIDRVHQRPEGTASRNFRKNRDRFIEDEDFFDIPFQDWSEIPTDEFRRLVQKGGRKGFIKFITERGYLLLVKSFTDDLAWEVQKRLIDGYFRAKLYEQARSEFPEFSCRLNGEQFDRSADRFEKALKIVKLMGIRNRREFLLTANRITKDSTGLDLVDLIRPDLKAEPCRPEKKNIKLPVVSDADEDMLAGFVELWWEAYGGNPVYTNQLCALLSDTDILFFPGHGKYEKREHAIRVSRILSRLEREKQAIGDYRIAAAGKKRNMRLWQLVQQTDNI
ncbi:hypothetical protein DENIS_5055 [Desulfonema ishimotonii]|uniref:KilA-N DNA-binding domain-containing protein n=1 Tax=Desulfonema ishimotonii TaxID=45657 RepID=A0A401G4B5_9BACT|nr:ORF6N domain-containing protein [Desulfonema ishimotonii]GBC64054.1 hypothetical protein DENIS_5055 [Desulfonema ishimotonii]